MKEVRITCQACLRTIDGQVSTIEYTVYDGQDEDEEYLKHLTHYGWIKQDGNVWVCPVHSKRAVFQPLFQDFFQSGSYH